VVAIAEIRRADVAERDFLRDLHRRSSLVWAEDRAPLEAHPEVFGVAADAIAAGRARVAVDEHGVVVGFVVVCDTPDGGCELDDLFVEPRLMRRGIGRALVDDAAARAVRAGHSHMSVVAHRRNFPFYERVGFVAGEAVATRFGPAVRMHRRLPARTS
jgi:GNAT superfamily N-acetyltransferase